MKKFIALDELWKCETCFHHSTGKCSPMIWCDHGESYRLDYDKLTTYIFDENDVKMKIKGYE